MQRDEMHDRRIGLADCNNFFASCERRADNSLCGRPVVVLSGNDGCIIARSNEVKAMGVPMGAPYFKYRDFLAYNGVAVRSANNRLYAGISSQVMSIIKRYTDCQEIYSIDECFFNMAIQTIRRPAEYCAEIRREVWKESRIPISIGIAPTKTLAKLGAEYAKKHRETEGVFHVEAVKYRDSAFMEQFECRDVWGIGPRAANTLSLFGIKNTAQLIAKDDLWIKEKFNIPMLNTLWELRGRSVNPVLNRHKPQQSIMVSRSFGEPTKDFCGVKDALITFTVSAAAQLRRAKLQAGKISVFIATNRFGGDYYANSREQTFKEPASLDGELIERASALLKEIYIDGRQYKKCGVLLSELSNISCGRQGTLFEDEGEKKRLTAAAAVDKINKTSEKPLIKPAILNETPEEEKHWRSRSTFKSGNSAGVKKAIPDNLRFQSHAEDF